MFCRTHTSTYKQHSFLSIFWILILSFAVSAVYAKVKTKKVKLETAKNIAIPKVINGFVAEKPVYYERPELGAGIQYKHPEYEDVSLTLYLYPIAEAPISLEYRMRYEFESTILTMQQVSESKGFKNAIFNKQLIKKDTAQVLMATAELVDLDIGARSHVYLSSDAYHFKKIRLSYPIHRREEHAEWLHETVLRLVNHIRFKRSQEMGISVQVATDEMEQSSSDIRMQLIYGPAMVASISEFNLIDSFERELRVYSVISEIMRAIDADEGTRDAQFWTILADKDFLDEWVWVTFKADYWEKPEGLELKKFEDWAKTQEELKSPLNPSFMLSLERK